ncbi:hypothetical protein [Streptomyces cadmiisoli]|uniref:hypothetical protein n=1 Tax=Streptomyces cadmiisoli TaxID=2184053 RepID=UPI003665E535
MSVCCCRRGERVGSESTGCRAPDTDFVRDPSFCTRLHRPGIGFGDVDEHIETVLAPAVRCRQAATGS